MHAQHAHKYINIQIMKTNLLGLYRNTFNSDFV